MGGINEDSPEEPICTLEDEKIAKRKKKDSYEVAESEFELFAAAWDLDTDLDYMSEEEETDFLSRKRRIIRKIVSGAAIINENGDIEYTLTQAIGTLEKVTIKRPSGHSIVEMDKVKSTSKVVAKTNAIYADAMEIPASFLSSIKMDGIDYKFIQGAYLLFFGS